LLEAVAVHALELLHVEEVVPDLDVLVDEPREQIDLVALLDAVGSSAAKRSSAAPKSPPKARHSHLGTISAMTDDLPGRHSRGITRPG
jgi:hypothetical protein